MLGLLLGCTPGGGEVSGIVPLPVKTDTSETSTDTPDTAAEDTTPADTGSAAAAANILVVIVDDIGTEASACYDAQLDAARAPQPNLSGLCAEGLTFTDAWSYPLCSPTRAAMMTGKYGWRTGIGRAINDQTGKLSIDEVSIADLLTTHQTAYIGKWHLTDRLDDFTHPTDLGWDHYTGTLGGAVEDYYAFEKVVDGEPVWVERYATSEVVDDALAWLAERDGEIPWVMFVGFQAAHSPYHVPPAELIDHESLSKTDLEADVTPLFQAMIAAMDVELGRLLEAVDREDTVIIYVGDNGSTGDTNQGTYADGQGKSTLHQGGVHVPLVITGAGIPAGQVTAMVHVVDLFATVAELAGAAPEEPFDSVSMVPYLSDPKTPALRSVSLTELFGADIPDDRGGRAARDAAYKYIRHFSGDERLYHLPTDPTEKINLLEDTLDTPASEAWSTLSAYIDQINQSASR